MALNELRRLTINVTSRCTSRCLYCSYPARAGADFPRDSLLALLTDANAEGVQAVRFSGGEPGLYPRLFELIEFLDRRGMASMICTSLRAPGRTWEKMVDAGLDVLSVSLDSLDERTFERLRGYRLAPVLKRLDALSALQEGTPFEIVLSVVLTPVNLASASGVAQFAADHDYLLSLTAVSVDKGLPPADVAALTFTANHERALRELLHEIEGAAERGLRLVNSRAYYVLLANVCSARGTGARGSCRAGRDEAIVALEGKLKLCHLLPGVPYRRSLSACWNSAAADKLRQRIATGRCPGCRLSCHTDERRDAPLRHARARAGALL